METGREGGGGGGREGGVYVLGIPKNDSLGVNQHTGLLLRGGGGGRGWVECLRAPKE